MCEFGLAGEPLRGRLAGCQYRSGRVLGKDGVVEPLVPAVDVGAEMDCAVLIEPGRVIDQMDGKGLRQADPRGLFRSQDFIDLCP